MSNFVPTKHHLREVLLYFFNLKKSAAEAHRLLTEAYAEYVPSISTCERWFVRFRSGDFDTEDKDRPGQPKKFEDEELEALFDKDSCQTQEELAESLGVTQAAISKRLKATADSSFEEFEDETNSIPIEMVEIQEIDADYNTKNKFECIMCLKMFARKMHLKQHMIIHTDERAFKCTITGCDSRFRRLDHLKNHLNTHSQIKHECTYCQQTYSRADYLRHHIKAQHTENDVGNEESAVNFPKKQIQDNSLEVLKIQFECIMCHKLFARKTHLKRHMTIHTDERAFECIHCNKKFRRRDHLQNHLNTHAQLRTKKCDFCEYTSIRADNLRNHIRARHTEKESHSVKDVFTCSECNNRSFSSLKNLKAHKGSHSKSYNCKRCDAEFKSKSDMNKHVSDAHPNELKNHLCETCGISFSRYDYLLIHRKRHRGEKTVYCTFCDKGFVRLTDLRVHEKYHTNEKTHHCSICMRSFSRSYNLTIHMRVHTGEKPFVCTHSNCFQAFAQSNDLKVHLRRHTGERFECDVDTCNESFIQMYLLTRHKRHVHGIDVQSNIKRLTKFIPLPLERSEETIQPENRFMQIPPFSN